MKIALGADSAGKPLIDAIEAHLKAKGQHEVTNLSQSGYYADLSAKVAGAVMDGSFERAILSCGTGIGVCIAIAFARYASTSGASLLPSALYCSQSASASTYC